MKPVEEESYPSQPEGDMLTSPFNLVARLTAPRFRIDTIGFLDVGLIALLTLLLSQSLFFSPGVSVDLPIFSEKEGLVGVRTQSVATVWQGNIVTVLGSYPLTRMDVAFRDLRQESENEDDTLLLLIDRSTPLENIAEIYENARAAGFHRVQMAARATAPSL